MKKLLSLLLFLSLSGCHLYSKDDQSFGVRFGTDISFYSTAKQTGGVQSEAGIESKLLEELMNKSNEDSTNSSGD